MRPKRLILAAALAGGLTLGGSALATAATGPPSNPQCSKWVGKDVQSGKTPEVREYVGYDTWTYSGNPTGAGAGACILGGDGTYGYGLSAAEGDNPYTGTIVSVSLNDDTPSGHITSVAQFARGANCGTQGAKVGAFYESGWVGSPQRVCL